MLQIQADTVSHYPVMLPEVLEALKPADNEVYIDGTFGAGGYTRAMLDHADCTVVAIDRDPAAEQHVRVLKGEYGDRMVFINGRFGDIESLLQAGGFKKADALVLDLGVSSMQLDRAERGFSFRADGPLDMRMDNSAGETAADIVNRYTEKDLADLIFKYGDERHSRKIAKKIVEQRRVKKFTTTGELAKLVRAALPKPKKDDIDPATRTFQALRIAVNDELGELERALEAAEKILKPGGRIIIVSFHSLEDGIVKKFLRAKSAGAPQGSRHKPAKKREAPVFSLITKKAVQPSDAEIAQNPRSRSAKMRAARYVGPA